MDNIPIEEMPEEIDRLLEINEELKDRIDKAIEYIEKQSKFVEGCDIYKICDKDTLLKVLKGSDEE